MRDRFVPRATYEDDSNPNRHRIEAETNLLIAELEERLGLFPGDLSLAVTHAAMARYLRHNGETEFIRHVAELQNYIGEMKDVLLSDALRNYDSRLQ